MFHYNQFNLAESKRIYLARPGQHKIGQLDGIETARLYVYLQDLWKVEITIDKYIDGKINKLYNKIQPLMEIFIENIGWFRIDSPSSEHQSDGRVYLNFTANGIETQLNDIDLVLFYINTGESPSYEIFDENLDALGIPKQNIQLYIKSESQNPTNSNYWGLGLLNILEHNYLRSKGWKIGHIDNDIAVKRGRRFQIDTATCYNTLTNDISVAYECIFTFDRINRLINAYNVKSVGKSLNIECSFRNLINSVDITPQENVVYTRFNCAGANDETTISYVNFGSPFLHNLNSVITNIVFPQGFVDKYKYWTDYRESRRKEFADTFKEYLSYLNRIKQITNQLPTSAVNSQWNAYTVEELKVERDKFQAMLDRLIELNTVDGVLKIEESNDYALYLSIKDVIIPDIKKEIERQEAGSVEKPDKVKYKFMWELYGINGLKERLRVCENNVKTLKAAGYDKPYNPDNTSLPEDAYNRQHQEYLDNVKYVNEINARLDILNKQVSELQSKADAVNDKRKQILDDVDVRNAQFNFTTKEIETINVLYIDTDFTDSTIEVVDTSDIDDVLQSSWDLYEAAKEELEIRSKPQYKFDISLDNLYHIPQFQKKAESIEVGDFMYLEFDGNLKSKQRIIGYDIELVNFSNLDLNFSFSDAVNAYGKVSDYRFLFSNSGSVSKNSITKETQKYISDAVNSAANNVFNDYFGGSGGGGISVFPNGISADDLLKLQDALSGLINGSLTLDELKAKLAQVDVLEANSAFVKYLEAKFLVANQGDFKDLSALVAQIDNLLAGNVSTELGHIISLTAQNVKIDEAVIRDLIAAQITVSMLQAGEISADKFHITSDDGGLSIVGNTMQFSDKNGNVRIQIGRDENNDFTFVLYDESGQGVLIDSTGIKPSAIEDGLIKNNMISNGTISKDKLNFNIVEGNPDGSIDASKVVINGQGIDAQFTHMESTITGIQNEIGQLQSSIPYVLDIYSTRGRTFKSGIVDTILQPILYYGQDNVTSQYDDSHFIWTRQSVDSDGDMYWNQAHQTGTKNLHITNKDVYGSADFSCSFYIDNKLVTRKTF